MKHSSSTKVFASILAIIMIATTLITVLPPVEISAANIVITLDAGHGGHDPGATGASAFGGMTEAQYNLIFCQYIKERLEQYGGFTVYLTRSNDTYIEISQRPTIAKNNGSNAFVSVHCNSFSDASANGTEVITRPSGSTNYTASKNAAQVVLNKVVAATGNKSRGLKTSTNLGVLNGANNKGISVGMLVETGFVTNQNDYNRTFATDAKRKATAYAIADGLAEYYGKSSASVAPATGLLQVSNDELRYLDASGNQIGQAFTPGQYDAWNKTLHITTDAVKTLVDWGWAAFNANSYQYGYIVNGTEMFSSAYTAATEAEVQAVISGHGSSAKGSRFMGTLDTSKLKVGSNNVKFCVKLNGSQNVVLREYTAVVTNPNVPYVSNDYNACISAAGQTLVYPFNGGAGATYEAWNKKISLRTGIVDHIDDYGWVAMENASSYQFGYIINNSTEIFKDSFTASTESEVKNVCAANYPGTTPSRFLASLPTSSLSVGTNNVKLCVRMNGTFTTVIREYTVELRNPSVLDNANDELRLVDAGGNVIGQAYTPGQYGAWNKTVTIDRTTVKTLSDWGWTAVDADFYEFGYIINGTQLFGTDYKYETGDDVKAVIANYGANASGSRYLTSLSTDKLNAGANNVKFCVKLNGNTVVTLREYTVQVNDTQVTPETQAPAPETQAPAPETPAQPTTPAYNGKYCSSIDMINNLGPNGTTHFTNRGGSTQNGLDTIDAAAEKIAINGTLLTVSGWLALEGGVQSYVFSVDDGKTWLPASGGYDGEPLAGHFANIGISNATKNAMFNVAVSPFAVDLTAYAGQTITISLGAIPAADTSKVTTFVKISNYAVPASEAEVEPETQAPAPTPNEPAVLDAPNDELRLMDASGNQIGQAYTPGQYDAWNKSVIIDRTSVKSLVEWGWVAVEADTFEFGYIINGTERFGTDFKYETDAPVKAAIAAYGAKATGSRYLATLSADTLNVGTNTVQFCVKLNGSKIVALREYTVQVTDTTSSETTPPEVTPEETTPPEITLPETPVEPLTSKYWSSVDMINSMGSNGAPYFDGRGGNHQKGTDTIDAVADKICIDGLHLRVGGWVSISGGVHAYEYTVDGGQTWKPVYGAYDGEPLLDYFKNNGYPNATKNAMFNAAVSPLVVDLTAYAGQTVTVSFRAISEADTSKAATFLTVANYAVPSLQEETPTPDTPTEDETNAPAEGETNAPAEGETNAPAEGETNAPNEDETNAPAENETNAPNEDETNTPAEDETNAPSENETNAPAENETNAPAEDETNAPSEDETNASSAGNDSNTVDSTDTTSDTASQDSEDADEEAEDTGLKSGCGSTLSSLAAVLLATMAGAVCLKKRKED